MTKYDDRCQEAMLERPGPGLPGRRGDDAAIAAWRQETWPVIKHGGGSRRGDHPDRGQAGRAIKDRYNETMGNRTAIVLYVLALIAVVVGVDILFFRHQFWPRLIVNVGIVLVFGAFYLRFLKR
jgi:hypothetical protein